VDLAGKVALVTGGGNGIGRAMCRRFAAEGAAGVAVVDLDPAAAEAVAAEVGGLALPADVGDPGAVAGAARAAEDRLGPLDLVCANAGVAVGGGVDTPDPDWQRAWDVNVMAHVWLARAVVPGMVARGSGYLLHTASAAGLLTNIGAAPYAVTKHAVVALAEWLAITYGDAGIRVSCLCPQGVNTAMLTGDGSVGSAAASAVMAAGRVVEPDDVADAVVAGLADERFLILPHPEVADYERRRAEDRDRWLAGMRRLQARIAAAGA
jgi:NAD(P)-dependent dehydrogenase (short-subunit alcohol dehydrogenase family)